MERGPVRETVRHLLRQNGIATREASLAMGRNASWLQQFLTRGLPVTLRRRDREVLASLLGCAPSDLWPAGVPLADIPEIEVAAAAGGGAAGEGNPPEVAR